MVLTCGMQTTPATLPDREDIAELARWAIVVLAVLSAQAVQPASDSDSRISDAVATAIDAAAKCARSGHRDAVAMNDAEAALRSVDVDREKIEGGNASTSVGYAIQAAIAVCDAVRLADERRIHIKKLADSAVDAMEFARDAAATANRPINRGGGEAPIIDAVWHSISRLKGICERLEDHNGGVDPEQCRDLWATWDGRRNGAA
jgi:hypothetical protein